MQNPPTFKELDETYKRLVNQHRSEPNLIPIIWGPPKIGRTLMNSEVDTVDEVVEIPIDAGLPNHDVKPKKWGKRERQTCRATKNKKVAKNRARNKMARASRRVN